MKKKKQGTPKKETDIANKNKNTPAKKFSIIARKSPRLNPTEIPVEMPDDLLQGKKNSNPKHQGTKKHLNFESAEHHNDIIEIGHTDAVKQTKDEGKKVAMKLLPTRRNTRHAGGVKRNKIPLLQLFGTMCEAKMSDQEWIPYLLDDGIFHLEGIRAHIGRRDCSAVLSMDAIGVNVIEVYIA